MPNGREHYWTCRDHVLVTCEYRVLNQMSREWLYCISRYVKLASVKTNVLFRTPRIRALFQHFDANNSGCIDAAEFRSM